jgi:tetratricopeptide (TPR) repeat protein
MELVSNAEPITRYCERHQLDTRARLELFMRVCHAVQHAHYKGIVHRDLKPGNILVSEVRGEGAAAKIIDFGIAKAIDTGAGTDRRTLLTQRFDGPVGTLAYMSPEQAAGSDDVDTRTDVYSLGVILYELLTGAVPIEPPTRSTQTGATWAQILSESHPLAPSARLRSGGTQSGELRGDLDWITLKAMDADRARRYGSASELAEDVRRYLKHEPVTAARPSRLYRARKFVRRNRVLVVASACVAISLCAGIVLTTTQMVRARRAERIALKNQQRERAINTFLNDLIESSDPRVIGGGPSMSVKDLLKQAMQKLDKSYEQDPAIEVPLRLTIGRAFRGMGYFDLAEQQLRQAYEVGRRGLGEGASETIRAADSLAAVLSDMDRTIDAEPIARRNLEVLRAANRTTDRQAIIAGHRYAEIEGRLGHYDLAEPLLRQSVADHEKYLGADDPQTLDAATGLGRALGKLGKLDEAEAVLRRVVDGCTRTLGPEHPLTLARVHFLGRVLADRGDLVGAEKLYRQAVAGFDRVAPNVAQSQRVRERLAWLLCEKGEYAEAEALFRKSYDAWKQLRGPDDPVDTLRSRVCVIHAMRLGGHFQESEPLYRELVAAYDRIQPDAPALAELRNRWGDAPTATTQSATTRPGSTSIPSRDDEP